MGLRRPSVRTLAAAGLLAVAGYYAVWGGEYSVFDLLALDQQRHAEQAALAELRAEIDSLRTEADRVERDPETIERIARERFGLIRRGETLVRFVPAAEPADSLASGP